MLNSKTDVAAIRGALQQLAQAWGRGDSAEYAALFTPDAEYVAFDGTQMSGTRDIDNGHRGLFAGIMRGSTMTFEPPSIRFVDDQVAIVIVRGGIIMRWQKGKASPSAKRMSTLTFVFVQTGDTWRAASFQNTRYRPWDKSLFGRMMSRSGSKATRDE
jgi:uncharacterized protein (TIGR02246 family)